MTPPTITDVSVLTEHGGWVDWSPDGAAIAFDRLGDDGSYDVWLMAPDGSDARNLTADHDDLDLPAGHKGNPSWHPSGEWLVVQVEQADHPGPQGAPATHPGAGIFNDLWALRADGGEAFPLVRFPPGTPAGALHPHYSADGSVLVWAQYEEHPPHVTAGSPSGLPPEAFAEFTERSIRQLFGRWSLASAPGDLATDVLPKATTVVPGRGPAGFCETHDVTADHRAALVTANPDPWQPLTGIDILLVDLGTGDTRRRVTATHDEWDEHAHFAPSGSGRVVWTSSRDLRPDERYPFDAVASRGLAARPPRADLWVAEPDDSQWRLTFFNTPTGPSTSRASTSSSAISRSRRTAARSWPPSTSSSSPPSSPGRSSPSSGSPSPSDPTPLTEASHEIRGHLRIQCAPRL